MRAASLISWALPALEVVLAISSSSSTAGIEDFVQRRLPRHVHDFEFSLDEGKHSAQSNDTYKVSSSRNGKILVEGNSLSALMSGLVNP